MKTITLHNGFVSLVDDEDFELLNQYKWYYCGGYATRSLARKTKSMHRIILDAPPTLQVDHINGDGLDNRKCNLRLATRVQNSHNRRKNKSGNSYKGVRELGNGCWISRITDNGKRLHIGHFATETDAAIAYDCKAKELYGEFAYLNFPDLDTSNFPLSEKLVNPKGLPTSKYKHVQHCTTRHRKNKWRACVKRHGKTIFDRTYATEEEAATAVAEVLSQLD